MGESNSMVNELLFFIQNKLKSTSKDAIVNMCVKFYSLEEIKAAIKFLEDVLETRLSGRNKDNLEQKHVSDLYDKLWSIDGSSTRIQFLGADLNRVPRETDNSDSLASIDQLLASIHSLKSTVTQLQAKMVTREYLEASLSSLVGNVDRRQRRFSHPNIERGTILHQ